jgi:hypothetical protein
MEHLKTINQNLTLSNRMLELQIKHMAVKEKRGDDKKPKWYLKE